MRGMALAHLFLVFLAACLHAEPSACVTLTNGTPTPTPTPTPLETYLPAASAFFPQEYRDAKPSLKFPEEEQEQEQEQERGAKAFQTAASEQVDDIDEKTAVDIILAATKSGRTFDLRDDTSDLHQLTSDPKIKAQVAAGNDAQARHHIREKLCDLGLMPCPGGAEISKKHDYGPFDGGFGGIPFNDIKLVQPVAIKAVGPPISAVSLEPFKSKHIGPLPPIKAAGYGPPGGFQSSGGIFNGHGHGHGKQVPFYGPPLASSNAKPFLPPYNHEKPYGLGPLPAPGPIHGGGIGKAGPIYGGGGGVSGGKIVEHIHHHIHHTPATNGGYGTYGVIGGSGGALQQGLYGNGFEEYGAAQKPAISLATPTGTHLGTFPQRKNKGLSEENGGGDCVCVPINQCSSYDILHQPQPTSGREVVGGTGIPNSGLVGYNIDPRNRISGSVIESNGTEESYGSRIKNDAHVRSSATEKESQRIQPRAPRKKREDKEKLTTGESPKVESEGRFITSLLRDATFQNLTRFAGYEFGEDPSQLVKMEGGRLRFFGRLLGFEPTVGVSFGLPGGYPQGGGGYPLNPLGTDPLVNPYNDGGISLGPISVNPLLSFQKTKDKDKTKVFKPLVNLHITPNPSLLYGIKGFFHQKKAAKAHKFGHGYAYPPPVPLHVSVPLPVQPLPALHHLHDHQHYHYKYPQQYPQSSGYGWAPSHYNYPTPYASSGPLYSGHEKGWAPGGDAGYGYSQAYANAYSGYNGYNYGNYRAIPSSADALVASTFDVRHKDERDGSTYIGPTVSSGSSTFSSPHSNAGSYGYEDAASAGKYIFPHPATRESEFSSNNEDSALIQELLADGAITQAELDELNSSHDGNGGGGAKEVVDVRRGRTLFPSSGEELEETSLRAERPIQEQRLDRRILPTGNIETRLPLVASGPHAPSSNTDSKFFPAEVGQLSFRASNGHRRPTVSRVSFPGERKERSKRQIAHAEFGRVLHPSVMSQRQLNLGGSCRNGYVCCRNPISRPTHQSQGHPVYPGQGSANNYLQTLNSLALQTQLGQCGKRNARGITGRVTNSNPATADGDTDYGEYPWQVAILKKDGYDNVYVCGGSIIDERHVVTAAHCLKGLQPNDLRVRVGEWDVNHETEFYPHVERDVAGFAIHPDFYAGNLFNDIAVMRLEGSVDFRQNPHISPICMPPSETEFGGQRCFVTGWGKDAFGEKGKYQNVLKEVDLPVLRHFDCEQKLKRTRLGPDFVLHSGFICAGGEEGKDACKGDGGGPLVCNTQGTFMLTGIVSWGVGCGHREVPGVYVKVSHYRNWLLETIKV